MLLLISSLQMLNAKPAESRAETMSIGLAVRGCFSLSGTIARVLGKSGIDVMTGLMSLLLAALEVEVMADGLVKLFPVLCSSIK